MECKVRTGESREVIKAEGSHGDKGNRLSWPRLLTYYPKSQSQGEAEKESNLALKKKEDARWWDYHIKVHGCDGRTL